MIESGMIQKNVEEFSRLQDYMITCDKDSETYKKMKRRYIEFIEEILCYLPILL